MMGAGSPFGNLMAEAVKLKGAQQATLRPIWDSWPQYFQHSMFMQEPILAAREKPFEERMQLASEIKVEGNKHFSDKNFEEAVAQYEKALAIFKYCENSDPEWKKKGIRDDDIHVVDAKADDAAGQHALDALKVSLYLNISGASWKISFVHGPVTVSKIKIKEFALAIAACSDALEIDPTNAKAFYRRAQALITPMSSGAVEFEKALVDLEQACQHDPDNVECKKLYRRLREEQVKQRKLDKATFSGMFTRGSVVDDEPVDEKPVDVKERENQKRLEREARRTWRCRLSIQGNAKSAQELRGKIEQAKAAVASARATPPPRVDFFNPTPEMIEDGKKNGIDLTDKRVQQMLADLQDEHLSKGTVPRKPDQEPPKTKFQAALAEADEILATMSKDEIAQLLKSEGIDLYAISDRDQMNEMVRNVLATKLCDMPRPGDAPTTESGDTSSRSMRHIFALVALWVLFRMYSSGGFTMLARGVHALAYGNDEATSHKLHPVDDPFDDFDEF
ncbi:Aste57867_14707 [Aphanomyces stellatus]|uniref:Aste57867_14707 protein n=1 Tax=Aphanomyces stellatus TaxID=120398 RepID=A0A485L1P3_9STRA|nr:hypothetical protein As57867_014652 [Aphanomyces stellatus]VFT91525.1 Aste57867_14707 [Aphanomyces stellatus]